MSDHQYVTGTEQAAWPNIKGDECRGTAQGLPHPQAAGRSAHGRHHDAATGLRQRGDPDDIVVRGVGRQWITQSYAVGLPHRDSAVAVGQQDRPAMSEPFGRHTDIDDVPMTDREELPRIGHRVTASVDRDRTPHVNSAK